MFSNYVLTAFRALLNIPITPVSVGLLSLGTACVHPDRRALLHIGPNKISIPFGIYPNRYRPLESKSVLDEAVAVKWDFIQWKQRRK